MQNFKEHTSYLTSILYNHYTYILPTIYRFFKTQGKILEQFISMSEPLCMKKSGEKKSIYSKY